MKDYDNIGVLNHYKCPDCGYEWDDEWDCEVDDFCGECGTQNISPISSEHLNTEKND
jgi:predicted Zn-ribbon and HTH transcriptional regulator